jgi:hypothetical protein
MGGVMLCWYFTSYKLQLEGGLGTPTWKCKDNIKIDFIEVNFEYGSWAVLSQVMMNRYRDFVVPVVNRLVELFFCRCGNLDCSGSLFWHSFRPCVLVNKFRISWSIFIRLAIKTCSWWSQNLRRLMPYPALSVTGFNVPFLLEVKKRCEICMGLRCVCVMTELKNHWNCGLHASVWFEHTTIYC